MVLGAVAVTVGLAGCAGGDGGNGGTPTDGGAGTPDEGTPTEMDGGTPTEADGATPTEADNTSPTEGETPTEDGTSEAVSVNVYSHEELGDILADSEDMVLYMFDSDTQGESASTCYDGCAQAWPPLVTSGEPTAGDGVTAELTTFEREDGEMQVAANGWPLYYFQNDESPGDANGQAVNDVWWVLDTEGNPVRSGGETETETGN